MQCDNCGDQIQRDDLPQLEYKGKDFCSEACKEDFILAQPWADKQAEHKTESTSPKISGDTYEVVEAIGSDRGRINLSNLRRANKDIRGLGKRPHYSRQS